MGYSKSRSVLRRIEPQLKELKDGKVISWELEDEFAADRWAMQVRQGFSIARRYPDEFPEVKAAGDSYRISVQGNIVRAVPKVQPAPTPTGVIGYLEVATEPSGAPLTINRHLLVNPARVEDVIQRWISLQPSTEDLVIESCEFTNSELRQLAAWAAAMEPEWFVNLLAGSRRVTISLAASDGRIEP